MPIQNGRHFADDFSKCIFFNENTWIFLISIASHLIPVGPIGKKSALVQMMAWHRIVDKPLSESMMHGIDYWPIYEWLGLDVRNIYFCFVRQNMLIILTVSFSK